MECYSWDEAWLEEHTPLVDLDEFLVVEWKIPQFDDDLPGTVEQTWIVC